MPSSPISSQPAPKLTAKQSRQRITLTQRSRRISQLAFAAFIIVGSVMHYLATEDGAVPSVDAQ